MTNASELRVDVGACGRSLQRQLAFLGGDEAGDAESAADVLHRGLEIGVDRFVDPEIGGVLGVGVRVGDDVAAVDLLEQDL